jgi:hypothetical protein
LAFLGTTGVPENTSSLRNSTPYSGTKALILSDGKPGHVNQSRAFCALLGIPAHEVRIDYLSKLREGLLRARINFTQRLPVGIPQMLAMMSNFVTEPSIKSLQAVLIDKPAAVVSAGSFVSAANYVVSKTVGAKSVVLMRPSAIPLDIFDLIVLPEHDRRPGLPGNVVFTPVALSYFDENRRNAADEIIERRFGKTALYGNPLALVIGGISPYFSMSKETIVEVTRSCWAWATRSKRGMMVTTSRRTPQEVEDALAEEFSGGGFDNIHFVWGRKDPFNPLPALLPRACAVVVTEDSISMISEAILQGHRPIVVRLSQKRQSRKLARFQSHLAQAGFARWVDGTKVTEILNADAEDLAREPAVNLDKIKAEIERKLKLNERR